MTILWQSVPNNPIGYRANNADEGAGHYIDQFADASWNIYGAGADCRADIVSDTRFPGGKALRTYAGPNAARSDGNQRAELLNPLTFQAGSTYYWGWDYANQGYVSNSFQSLFQFKTNHADDEYSTFDLQVGANGFNGIRLTSGDLGIVQTVLSPMPTAAKVRLVLGAFISSSTTGAWVRAWVDGVQTNDIPNFRSVDLNGMVGGTLFPDGGSGYQKWGTYRQGFKAGADDQRFANLIVATTFAEANASATSATAPPPASVAAARQASPSFTNVDVSWPPEQTATGYKVYVDGVLNQTLGP
jgi:hypothetical protein